MNNVMNSLNLGEEFINKVIFDNLTSNYLTGDEINLFNEKND